MSVPYFTSLTTLCLFVFAAIGTVPAWGQESAAKQFYEVRTYVLGADGDEDAVDQYLSEALLPALQRQGIQPVGVFEPAPQDTNDRPAVIVVIPYRSSDQMAVSAAKLAQDASYLEAAKSYLDRGPKEAPYARISSELLVAMDCMPQLAVDANSLSNSDRVYELRLYESANERLGNLKVDMFNNGEVPIFHDSGITPLFIGQALVGPQTPNLTYLTVYPNDQARQKAWDAFRSHPDWQVLKDVAKYKGTVSKIDKYVLKAKPYSQM